MVEFNSLRRLRYQCHNDPHPLPAEAKISAQARLVNSHGRNGWAFTLPQGEIFIRKAQLEDAPRLRAIYDPYVTHTAVSFELQTPSLEEFLERMSARMERYPYIVVEEQGTIIGYAYASAFHEREAYAHCAEITIYLQTTRRHSGIGSTLYRVLELFLQEQHFLNLYACIAYLPEEELQAITASGADPHLTLDSVHFHAHMGYELNAYFAHSGYKFGRWYDMVWMEKMIGSHGAAPEPLLPAEVIYRAWGWS